MAFGPRKPSFKKSLKARTTGASKRKVKKAINPLYGKKGMGYINNPKKAIYNKVYNKTTFSVNPMSKNSGCLGAFIGFTLIPVGIIALLVSILIWWGEIWIYTNVTKMEFVNF